MGIRVRYLQSKASSPSLLNFKTQHAFANKSAVFLLLRIPTCKTLKKEQHEQLLSHKKSLSLAECSLLIKKLESTLIRNRKHVSLCYFTLQNYLKHGNRGENVHEDRNYENNLPVDFCYRGNN